MMDRLGHFREHTRLREALAAEETPPAPKDVQALRDDFAAAAERVYGDPKPEPRRPTTPLP